MKGFILYLYNKDNPFYFTTTSSTMKQLLSIVASESIIPSQSHRHIHIDDAAGILTIKGHDDLPIRFPQSFIKLPEDLMFVIKYYIQKYRRDFSQLLVHGSVIVENNHGYLFLGKSGVGKTTIARRSGLEVIADDVCVIDTIPSTIEVSNTPLDTSIKRNNKSYTYKPAHLPLHSIYFLQQYDLNYCNKISFEEGISALLSSTFIEEGEAQEKNHQIVPLTSHENKLLVKRKKHLLELVFDVASRVPMYTLFFNKDFQFRLAKLDKLLSHGG